MNRLTTQIEGSLITWEGHACEGAALRGVGLLLWPRCGDGDVPAGEATIHSTDPITCAECREVLAREGQFGVGA